MNPTINNDAVIVDAEAFQQTRQAPGGTAAPTVLDSVRLFNGRRELIIQHHGEQYRLRITRQEKLILTK
jgi:hemin uptake protein HemP